METALTIESFRPLLKSDFAVGTANGDVALTLVEVASMGRGAREGGAFSLLWEGPSETPLPQGTYILNGAGLGDLDIFLVPVAQFDEIMQYEAIYT